MTRDVVIVGGGLVGLNCAYYLRQEGAEVTVLERGTTGGGASRGNAGEICPAVAQPLSSPRMVRSALLGLHRPDSALYVHPIVTPELVRFLTRMLTFSTNARYRAGVRELAEFSAGTLERFDRLRSDGVDMEVNKKGYLYVLQSRAEAEQCLRSLRQMGAAVDGHVLAADELVGAEPCLSDRARAGLRIDDQWTLDPSTFVDSLTLVLRSMGVVIHEGVEVHEVSGAVGPGSRARVRSADGDVEADDVVVCAGAASRALLATSGIDVTMTAGKGYSFTVQFEDPPSRLVKLESARVAVTPMDGRVRIAGTMEFSRHTDRLDERRIDAIVHAASGYLRGVDWGSRSDEWIGARPMTPDGLPLVGPLPGERDVWLATGHNMLGLTLGPATGDLVSRMVTRGTPPPAAVDPTRFCRPSVRSRVSALVGRRSA